MLHSMFRRHSCALAMSWGTSTACSTNLLEMTVPLPSRVPICTAKTASANRIIWAWRGRWAPSDLTIPNPNPYWWYGPLSKLTDLGYEKKGVLYYNSKTRITDITDGTSKTLALGERAGDYISSYSKPLGFRGQMAGNWVGPSEARYPDQVLVCVVGSSTVSNSEHASNGSFLINGYSLSGSSKDNEYCVGSKHPGGANVGLADGSTRFISENIDAGTWELLGGIDDGNTMTKNGVTYTVKDY